jgi:hypothetical protein
VHLDANNKEDIGQLIDMYNHESRRYPTEVTRYSYGDTFIG